MPRGNTAPVYAFRQPQYQEQPVQVPARHRTHRLRLNPMALYGAVICITVLCALLYLSQFAVMAHMNLQIHNLREEVKSLERENRDLERQAAYLASLERVERLAREELGMIPSAQVRYIQLGEPIQPVLAANPERKSGEKKPISLSAKWWRSLSPTAYAEGSTGQ